MDGSWENAFCLKGGDGRRLLEGLGGGLELVCMPF